MGSLRRPIVLNVNGKLYYKSRVGRQSLLAMILVISRIEKSSCWFRILKNEFDSD